MATQTRPLLRSRPKRPRLGGIEGNELLTMSVAVVLLVLLAAEFVTLLDLGPLLSVHMVVGLVLIPPVLLKLASTGYRMVRYYTRSPAYREKGPPVLPLRLLAPVLALSAVAMLGTGVWLLALGHKSDTVLFFHKGFVIAFTGLLGIHVLAYGLRTIRALGNARRRERPPLPGGGLRSMLIASSVGAGVVVAVVMSDLVARWQPA